MSVITETFLFKPPSLGSCYVWLDASTSNNFTFSSGTNIATWIDRSGNGYTATAVNNPTYDSTNKRVRFASASTQAFSNTSAPLNLAQRSFFFVLEEITNANVCGIMPIIPSPTTGTDYTTTNGMTIEGTSGVYFYANSGGYANRVNASVPLAKAIYSEVFSNPTGTPYLNGTAGTNATANFTPGTSAGYGLGGRWANGLTTPYFNGYFYEVLVYSKALSTRERQQIEGYLAWKWGLQNSLPAAHPFKNYRPLDTPSLRVPSTYTNPVWVINQIPFSPRGIPGLNLWLDAVDQTTIQYGSDTIVTSWLDKSGSGNHGIANGTITNSATINGRRAMNFSGSASTYFSGAVSNTNTTMTSFAIFIMNSSSYSVARILSLGVNGQGDFGSVLYTAAIQRNSGNYASYRANAYRSIATGTLGVPALVCCQYDGTNNIVYADGTAGTTVGSTGNFGYSVYNVGSSLNEQNLVPLNGNIGEVLHYTSSLTTAQRQLIEGYLAWKWGLIANLPANHPYKVTQIVPFSYPVPPIIGTSRFFTPRRIADCALWLDAFDPSSITTTGTQVTAITDKSGTNKALTITNTVSYSLKSAIVFTNTNGRFNISGMPAAPYDILTVVTPNSVNNIFRALLRTLNTSNPFLLNINTNELGMWDGTAFRQFGSLTILPNEKALVYATMATDRTMQAAKNGTPSLTASTPAATESAIAFIGNNTGSGGQPWGNLHELVIFSRTLALAERQQIEGYLAWKWGLNSSLPASHPFAKFPPSP